MWKMGSSLEGSGSFTRTSFRSTGYRKEETLLNMIWKVSIWILSVCLRVSYRLVHLELYVVLVAEQFIRQRWGELFTRVSQKQEVVEEESPEFLATLCLVYLKRNKSIIYYSFNLIFKQHFTILRGTRRIYSTLLLSHFQLLGDNSATTVDHYNIYVQS